MYVFPPVGHLHPERPRHRPPVPSSRPRALFCHSSFFEPPFPQTLFYFFSSRRKSLFLGLPYLLFPVLHLLLMPSRPLVFKRYRAGLRCLRLIDPSFLGTVTHPLNHRPRDRSLSSSPLKTRSERHSAPLFLGLCSPLPLVTLTLG